MRGSMMSCQFIGFLQGFSDFPLPAHPSHIAHEPLTLG
jgi:hypothetical protein